MPQITLKKYGPLVAILAMSAISYVPVAAQHVLICYTLHNDLANYDRRAQEVDHYFMPQLKEAREAAISARQADDSPLCLFGALEPCTERLQQQTARYRALKEVHARSHLGGSDTIRLRIIAEMYKYGCPISADDLAILEAARKGPGALK
jgi:hypothetical protein